MLGNDGDLLLSAVCIVQSIPIFSETGKFSLGLPNPLNVTIQFPFVLQVYLIALFLGKCLIVFLSIEIKRPVSPE